LKVLLLRLSDAFPQANFTKKDELFVFALSSMDHTADIAVQLLVDSRGRYLQK